jgi:hypothetical protein
MIVSFDVAAMEEKAKQTKKNLKKRKKAGETSITVGIDGLLIYCEQTLYLCKQIRKDKK